MNKFYIITLLVYSTLFCCFSSNVKKNNTHQDISPKDTLLLGKWIIIAHVIDGGTLNCYSCPQIQFLGNGTGIIQTPTNHKYKFKYTLVGDKLLLNAKAQKVSDLLCKNAEFHYELKDEDAFLRLVLSSKTGDCKLILSKVK